VEAAKRAQHGRPAAARWAGIRPSLHAQAHMRRKAQQRAALTVRLATKAKPRSRTTSSVTKPPGRAARERTGQARGRGGPVSLWARMVVCWYGPARTTSHQEAACTRQRPAGRGTLRVATAEGGRTTSCTKAPALTSTRAPDIHKLPTTTAPAPNSSTHTSSSSTGVTARSGEVGGGGWSCRRRGGGARGRGRLARITGCGCRGCALPRVGGLCSLALLLFVRVRFSRNPSPVRSLLSRNSLTCRLKGT
jgi:hypothetical protein